MFFYVSTCLLKNFHSDIYGASVVSSSHIYCECFYCYCFYVYNNTKVNIMTLNAGFLSSQNENYPSQFTLLAWQICKRGKLAYSISIKAE